MSKKNVIELSGLSIFSQIFVKNPAIRETPIHSQLHIVFKMLLIPKRSIQGKISIKNYQKKVAICLSYRYKYKKNTYIDMSTIPVSKKLFITFFRNNWIRFFHILPQPLRKDKVFSKKTVRHYSGNEENFDNEQKEYSEELLQEGFFFPKSYRENIEIIHVHAFTISLILFVLSRIFSMTKVREIFKIIIYSFAFIGTIMNLSGPWLIRYIYCILNCIIHYSRFMLHFSYISAHIRVVV